MTSIVVDFIDHPIVTLTDAIPIIVPRELFRAVRPRVGSQRSNLANDTAAVGLGPYPLKLLPRRGLDRELI
jgi:hypothetical protein